MWFFGVCWLLLVFFWRTNGDSLSLSGILLSLPVPELFVGVYLSPNCLVSIWGSILRYLKYTSSPVLPTAVPVGTSCLGNSRHFGVGVHRVDASLSSGALRRSYVLGYQLIGWQWTLLPTAVSEVTVCIDFHMLYAFVESLKGGSQH